LLHSLVTQGLVFPEGSFVPVPFPDPVCLMELFRHKLIKALLAREKTPRPVMSLTGFWFSAMNG